MQKRLVCEYFNWKIYLMTTQNIKPLTIDLDRCNERTAQRVARKINKEFHAKVSVYKTRRGHYQISADFKHTLLDNILIRLLCNDDMFRLQYDIVRMFNRKDTHNTLFEMKLRIDDKGIRHDRKARKLIKTLPCDDWSVKQ